MGCIIKLWRIINFFVISLDRCFQIRLVRRAPSSKSRCCTHATSNDDWILIEWDPSNQLTATSSICQTTDTQSMVLKSEQRGIVYWRHCCVHGICQCHTYFRFSHSWDVPNRRTGSGRDHRATAERLWHDPQGCFFPVKHVKYEESGVSLTKWTSLRMGQWIPWSKKKKVASSRRTRDDLVYYEVNPCCVIPG